MRIQHIFLNSELINTLNKEIQISDPKLNMQIKNVLRLKVGDQIVFLDENGIEHKCQLTRFTNNMTIFSILESKKAGGEPSCEIVIAFPILKGDRFEWGLQKLTELGATQVIPIITSHSVVKMGKDSAKKVMRWQKIMQEATEQCERAKVPTILSPIKFTELFTSSNNENRKSNHLTLICAERKKAPSIYRFLTEAATFEKILIIVGPEGGFTEAEIELALNSGAKAVTLGPRILRAETAAICALAQVIAILEDG